MKQSEIILKTDKSGSWWLLEEFNGLEMKRRLMIDKDFTSNKAIGIARELISNYGWGEDLNIGSHNLTLAKQKVHVVSMLKSIFIVRRPENVQNSDGLQ